MKIVNRAKVLLDKIGRAKGLSFRLRDYRDRDWLIAAVKDFSIEDFDYKREEDSRKRKEEYEFGFESMDGSKFVLRHRSLTLSKEEENRILEEALDWMLREARCRDVTLKTGKEKGAPRFCGLDVRLNFLRKPIVVIDKGIYTRVTRDLARLDGEWRERK